MVEEAADKFSGKVRHRCIFIMPVSDSITESTGISVA